MCLSENSIASWWQQCEVAHDFDVDLLELDQVEDPAFIMSLIAWNMENSSLGVASWPQLDMVS